MIARVLEVGSNRVSDINYKTARHLLAGNDQVDTDVIELPELNALGGPQKVFTLNSAYQ